MTKTYDVYQQIQGQLEHIGKIEAPDSSSAIRKAKRLTQWPVIGIYQPQQPTKH